ncbi:MAG TPA: hypothetical protein VMU10_08190 [Desulfomonilia bacterium]|nr:hypothetical protein [Desulfomonilia bacterium]
MKKLIHLAMLISFLFAVLFIANAVAGQCSEALIKAMKDEGLSDGRIKSICSRAETYAHKKSSAFTPEKIRQDLVGKSVGPESPVKVRANEGNTSGMPSYDVYTTVPMGLIFDETNISDISVLDTKTHGNTSQVIVHVDTVSSCSGKLRLSYELIAGEWVLRQIENLDFKQQ